MCFCACINCNPCRVTLSITASSPLHIHMLRKTCSLHKANVHTPIFLYPMCLPYVIVSAHSQFEVQTRSHNPFSLPLALYAHIYVHTLQNTQMHTSCFFFFFFFSPLLHTPIYTQTRRRPVPSLAPEGYTERYASGSCSLISSSHTHSGSAITSGGPVRHECYPVDNNHSGGRGRDPIPYLLTAPHPPSRCSSSPEEIG